MASKPPASTLAVPVTARDHALGSADAPVTLLEYGDYQCPQCAAVHPIVKQLREQMGDRLRFVYRHLPLAALHPDAMLAAQASEAAAAQDRFWEMHDLLFADQHHLDFASLVERAKGLGIDVKRFEQDLQTHLYLPRVQEDYRGAIRSGAKTTPSCFINATRYTGPYDLAPMLEAIRSGART